MSPRLPIALDAKAGLFFQRMAVGGETSKEMLLVVLLLVRQTYPLDNMALNKPANQSSDFPGDPISTADRAVDGNTDGNRYHGFCSCTNQTTNSWWKVDLLGFYTIHNIEIFNRVDKFSYRLQQFEIRVSSVNPTTFPSTEGQRCVYYPSIVPVNGSTLACDQPITGRYVSVFKAANEHLTICEIRVFGERAFTGSFRKDLVDFRLSSPFLTSLPASTSVRCAAVCLRTDNCFAYSLENVHEQVLRSNTSTCDLGGYGSFDDRSPAFSQFGWSVYFRMN